MVGGGHLSEIEHPAQFGFAASSARRHDSMLLCASKRADLADVLVLTPQPFHDDRGLFTRTFDATSSTSISARREPRRRSSRTPSPVREGRDPRHARPVGARRGEAGALRARRGARRAGRHPQGSPTFGQQQAFLLDDEDVSASVRPARLPARLPGADRDRRRLLPHRSAARSRRGPRRRATTTRTWRSTGRCRSSMVSARDAGAGSWAELLTHLS